MESLLSLDRPIHRFAYLFNTLATLAISSGLGYGLFQWLSPKHGFYPLAWFLCIVIGAFAAGILLLLTIRRLRDIQSMGGLLAVLIWIPPINLAWYLMLVLIPGKKT